MSLHKLTMSLVRQNRFVDQLAQSLLSGGDANDLLKKASAGEYDVKALLVNAVQLLPESKLRTGLRKNATFHVRKLLEMCVTLTK